MVLTRRVEIDGDGGVAVVVCDGDKEVFRGDKSEVYGFDAARGLLFCGKNTRDGYVVSLHRYADGEHMSMQIRCVTYPEDVWAAVLSPDGTRVAVSTGGIVTVFHIDMAANTCDERKLAVTDPILTLQWHPSGDWLLTATDGDCASFTVRLHWMGDDKSKRKDVLLHADTLAGVEYPLARTAQLSPCGRFCAFANCAYDESDVARAHVLCLAPVLAMDNPHNFQESLTACCVFTKNDYGCDAKPTWTSDGTLRIDGDKYTIREDMKWGTCFEGDEGNVVIEPQVVEPQSSAKRAKRDK